MSPKKSLSPEILPDPKRGGFAGGPRERVVRHAQTLLAGLALGGTALAEEPYRVVDPMPPPARCDAGVSGVQELKARRVDDHGTTTVELSMYAMAWYRVALAHPAALSGATLVSEEPGAPMTFVLKPTKDAKEIVVPLSLTCQGSPPERPVLKVVIALDPKVPNGAEFVVTSTRERDGGR